MPDVDRSGRVVRLPAGQVRRRRAPEASDLTRRLAALERQVERALTSAGASPSAFPSLETVVDAMLLGFDRARRALTGEPEAAATLFEAPLDFLYRRWWRVEVIGRERLPRRGPVLVVANRVAAALPYDAPILARALSQGTPEPRVVVPLLDAWLLDLPLVGAVLTALGACAARGAAARRVLAAGETAVAFPEGSGAIGKPLEQRYRLAPFRHCLLYTSPSPRDS